MLSGVCLYMFLSYTCICSRDLHFENFHVSTIPFSSFSSENDSEGYSRSLLGMLNEVFNFCCGEDHTQILKAKNKSKRRQSKSFLQMWL